MTLKGALSAWAALVALAAPSVAAAQETVGSEFLDPPREQLEKEAADKPAPKDEKRAAGYIPGYRRIPSVGLSPHAPQNVPGLPGIITPSFGAPTAGSELRFEFHGYLATALRAGIGSRDDAIEGQKTTTLHADPIVAGAGYGWLEAANVVPGPWSQLTFQYGNDTVRATAIIGSWSLGRSQDAAGYTNTDAQIWINDAFLVYSPNVAPFGLAITAGAYADQYGQMAQYSNGQYGVPLMGSIRGVGVKSAFQIPLEGNVDVTAEGGFKGNIKRVPVGIALDQSTNYPVLDQGATYAAHGHLSATWSNITPALHYIHSWSQDDSYAPVDDPITEVDDSIARPDGSLDVYGADIRANLARFGYFYAGVSHVRGRDTVSVSNLVQIVNSGGGRDFMERFWGAEGGGNGTLTLVGAEYTLSLGTLLRYPDEFWGVGPDLTLTVFGMYANTSGKCDQFFSDFTEASMLPDCVPGGSDGQYDKDVLKYGIEGIYSFSKHVIGTLRLDRVHPWLGNSEQNFVAITPRIIFRSEWITRETVGIQYSGFINGPETPINGDIRLINTGAVNDAVSTPTADAADEHMVALFATMWW